MLTCWTLPPPRSSGTCHKPAPAPSSSPSGATNRRPTPSSASGRTGSSSAPSCSRSPSGTWASWSIAVLQSHVDAATRHRLWEASQGNVLYLRELVLGAIAAGTLGRRAGGMALAWFIRHDAAVGRARGRSSRRLDTGAAECARDRGAVRTAGGRVPRCRHGARRPRGSRASGPPRHRDERPPASRGGVTPAVRRGSSGEHASVEGASDLGSAGRSLAGDWRSSRRRSAAPCDVATGGRRARRLEPLHRARPAGRSRWRTSRSPNGWPVPPCLQLTDSTPVSCSPTPRSDSAEARTPTCSWLRWRRTPSSDDERAVAALAPERRALLRSRSERGGDDRP